VDDRCVNIQHSLLCLVNMYEVAPKVDAWYKYTVVSCCLMEQRAIDTLLTTVAKSVQTYLIHISS